MPEEKYQCKICKLHYLNKAIADKCYLWCSTHDSCNLEIATQSLEALEYNKRGKK